jgi:hypothetical protein
VQGDVYVDAARQKQRRQKGNQFSHDGSLRADAKLKVQ